MSACWYCNEEPTPTAGDLAAERELQNLRERVTELEALVGAGARMLDEVRAGRDEAPGLWRALSDGQRLELMALCCHGCGSLDTGCRCWDDS